MFDQRPEGSTIGRTQRDEAPLLRTVLHPAGDVGQEPLALRFATIAGDELLPLLFKMLGLVRDLVETLALPVVHVDLP